MNRLFIGVGVLAILFAASGSLIGDDKDTSKDTKVVKQGALPANYSKLGLSDEQKKKIREIQGEYRTKIQELDEQIKALRKKERAEMEDVLTGAQKTRLRQLVLEKAPAEKEKN